jgi:hypothetical protein
LAGKVDLLFPFVPSGIRAKLQLDSTALPPLQTALHPDGIITSQCFFSRSFAENNAIHRNTMK